MRQDEEDPITLASFHIAVVQAVLLLKTETWVLLAAMKKRIAWVYKDILWKVRGKR